MITPTQPPNQPHPGTSPTEKIDNGSPSLSGYWTGPNVDPSDPATWIAQEQAKFARLVADGQIPANLAAGDLLIDTDQCLYSVAWLDSAGMPQLEVFGSEETLGVCNIGSAYPLRRLKLQTGGGEPSAAAQGLA